MKSVFVLTLKDIVYLVTLAAMLVVFAVLWLSYLREERRKGEQVKQEAARIVSKAAGRLRDTESAIVLEKQKRTRGQ